MKLPRFPVWFAVGLSLIAASLFGSVSAQAQSYNRFQPANGVLVGNTATYVTTAAASSDIRGLWTGTCSAATVLRGDGSCTAVALGSMVNGTTPVANGGTGAVTLSGVLKGNATSAFTSAANSDVISLWTGTCSASTYLRGDGSCNSPGGAGTVTSVAAGTGLTASPSPIISSGTISLDLAAANSWSSQQTHTVAGSGSASAVYINSATPFWAIRESGAAANNRIWDFGAASEQLLFRTRDDVGGVATWMAVDRTGTVVDSVAVTATAFTFNANPVAVSTTNTFSAVLTGCTGSTPTYNFRYDRVGTVATVTITNSPLGCTSNATAKTFPASTLPAAITPSGSRCVVALGLDNSVTSALSWTFQANGSLSISKGGCSTATTTTSGTFSGGELGTSFTYSVF